MSGSLHGMRVLDLSQQLPGPYATYLLAALGATVTKIEPPAGDAARHLDPAMFEQVNAGKSSVMLNLKSEAGQTRLHELVREADVLVEGFRPGVTARLGCDPATLHALRPALVYCSISGAGQSGPLAAHPTHDLSVQAMAGALAGDVARIGVPWVDLATGTTAALAITAAWHAGEGCHLDMSMLDAAVAWSRAKVAALDPGPEPTYGTLPTADGAQVVIALLEDAMWVRLCTALGWVNWIEEPRLAAYRDRRTHGAEVRERLERAVSQLTLDEVLALAEKHDLPVGPANATHDPMARAQIATRFPEASGRGALPLPAVLVDRLGPAPALDRPTAPEQSR